MFDNTTGILIVYCGDGNGSPLGAVVFYTGGILIDNGWIRILGSGHPRLNRSLPQWNFSCGLPKSEAPPPWLLVADDVLGGFFALNGGRFSPDGHTIGGRTGVRISAAFTVTKASPFIRASAARVRRSTNERAARLQWTSYSRCTLARSKRPRRGADATRPGRKSPSRVTLFASVGGITGLICGRRPAGGLTGDFLGRSSGMGCACRSV